MLLPHDEEEEEGDSGLSVAGSGLRPALLPRPLLDGLTRAADPLAPDLNLSAAATLATLRRLLVPTGSLVHLSLEGGSMRPAQLHALPLPAAAVEEEEQPVDGVIYLSPVLWRNLGGVGSRDLLATPGGPRLSLLVRRGVRAGDAQVPERPICLKRKFPMAASLLSPAVTDNFSPMARLWGSFFRTPRHCRRSPARPS